MNVCKVASRIRLLPQMGNVEVRKNKEGYELNLNALIYSELLMSNVIFLVTNQICRVLP